MEGYEELGMWGAGGKKGAARMPCTVGCGPNKQSEVVLDAGGVAVSANPPLSACAGAGFTGVGSLVGLGRVRVCDNVTPGTNMRRAVLDHDGSAAGLPCLIKICAMWKCVYPCSSRSPRT